MPFTGTPQPELFDGDLTLPVTSIAAGVPLPLVSKTLRHSQTSITADLYAHLTRETALGAADSLGAVLDAAAAELVNERVARAATTPRPHDLGTDLLSGSPLGELAGQGWSRLGESNPGPAHYE